MTSQTIYTLAESNITISDGAELSGFSQGSGVHLDGVTITLNSNAWQAISITESQTGDVSFADSDSSQSLDGDQSIDGTTFTDGSRVEAEYALTVEDPDGNTIRPDDCQNDGKGNGSESDVKYFHMLFDHHEIVISDGLATESYQFNLDCKDGVKTRREVRALFANLPKPSQYQTAVRPCITDKRAVLMRDVLIR